MTLLSLIQNKSFYPNFCKILNFLLVNTDFPYSTCSLKILIPIREINCNKQNTKKNNQHQSNCVVIRVTGLRTPFFKTLFFQFLESTIKENAEVARILFCTVAYKCGHRSKHIMFSDVEE